MKVSRGVLAMVLAMVLAVGLDMAALGACGIAYGDEALTAGTCGGSTIVSASDAEDKREVCGQFYRQGDYWYMLNPSAYYQTKPQYCIVDGHAYYSYYSFTPSVMSFGQPWLVYYYDTSEIFFQAGNYVDMDRVTAAGYLSNHDEMYRMFFVYYSNGSFCRSVELLGQNARGFKVGPYYEERVFDPRRVVFDDDFALYAQGTYALACAGAEGACGENADESADGGVSEAGDAGNGGALDVAEDANGSAEADTDIAGSDDADVEDDSNEPSPAFEHENYSKNAYVQELSAWDGLFAGLANLEEVEGLGRVQVKIESAERLFAGCEQLRELDLSGFDTRGAYALGDMLDGCVSLARLDLGPNWSQAGIEDDDRKARFPVDMTCGDGVQTMLYQAGDVIPDGAGTYIAAGHFDISSASMCLLPPGSIVVDELAYDEYANGQRALPAGATLDDLHVWQPGEASSAASLECQYTGAEIRPTVLAEMDGRLLVEGVDFRVSFSDNVEDGTAQVKVVGLGDCFGMQAATFAIADYDACAFLYESGLLLVKRGHQLPDNRVYATEPLVVRQRWFGRDGANTGACVPWAAEAARVKRVVFDESFAQYAPASAEGWFAGCANLTDIQGLEHVDLSAACSAAGMFKGCASLEYVSLGLLDTAKVQDFSSCFEGCASLKAIGVSARSFASAANLSGFFKGCTALSGTCLDACSLPSVHDASEMFAGCAALDEVDLSFMAASRVRSVAGMFDGCAKLAILRLGDCDFSSASDAGALLRGCAGLQALVTGAGWKNGSAGGTAGSGGASAASGASGASRTAGVLDFPALAYRVSPWYARLSAGAAVPDGAGEYRFGSIAMQFCTVVMDSATYECTGKLVEPKPQVMLGTTRLVQGVDYTLSYANNLFPGKASVTVLGKGAFAGGLVVPFTIEARVAAVGDRLVYKTKNVTYTFKVTRVTRKNGSISTMAVTLVGVKVKNGRVKTLSLPSQCTIGGVTATMTSVSSKLTGSFRNVRTVIVGSTVVVIGARAFASAPKVKALIVKSARLKSVSNCLQGSAVKKVTTRVWLSKAKRKTYRKWFTKSAGKSGVKFIYG